LFILTKTQKEASPSRLQEKSSNSYPVVYKRGTSLDYNKKLPETIEKLIRGREKVPAESDFETSFSKTKGPSNQTGKKMTKAWDIKMKPKGPQTSRGLFVSNNHMSRIENHLYTSTIKPSFARQHNRTSSEIENRVSQERQPNLRNKFPDIHKKSDKKLRSSV